MKLHFEPNLDFQLQAIEAVCDLFGGQEVCRTEFTVTRDSAEPQALLAYAKNDLGIGNRLTLLDDEILKNLKSIQLRNGLPPSDALDSGDFYHVFGTERPSTWAAPIWIEAPAIAGMPPVAAPLTPFTNSLPMPRGWRWISESIGSETIGLSTFGAGKPGAAATSDADALFQAQSIGRPILWDVAALARDFSIDGIRSTFGF